MLSSDKYTEICNEFELAGCKLTTTYDEMKELVLLKPICSTRLNFTGICGHQSSANYTNFRLRKTGINCKNCSKINAINKRKNIDKLILVKNEETSIKILCEVLENAFTILRTHEGCSADLLIRYKDSPNDEWIPIQVKTTQKICHNMYSFRHISDKYTGMIIICHSLDDNKVWIFPYSDSIPKTKLNISDTPTSKYNKYKYNIENLQVAIESNIHNCTFMTKLFGNTPNNIYQQREQQYCKKRMEYVPFLTYETISCQSSPSDFIANRKKVQEKVIGAKRGESYVFHLSSRNGINGRRTYKLGENDIYWFHSSFDDLFWIVPENELYNRKWISDSDKVSKCKHILINIKNYGKHKWLKEYEFNYSSLSLESVNKIKAMFSMI